MIPIHNPAPFDPGVITLYRICMTQTEFNILMAVAVFGSMFIGMLIGGWSVDRHYKKKMKTDED